MAYQADKQAAQKDRWRIPEQTLHLLALLGGWPEALLAQHRLRHKTKKQPFRFIFWVTVVLNSYTFAWLHTSGTAKKILSILTH